jgi:hypothetical protein
MRSGNARLVSLSKLTRVKNERLDSFEFVVEKTMLINLFSFVFFFRGGSR